MSEYAIAYPTRAPANPYILENVFATMMFGDLIAYCAREARQICYKCFDDLKLNYIKSNTNFILFNVDKIGAEFSKKMQAQNIYVQYRDHFGGKWCRVSMGTIEEMQSFCSALKSIAG